MLCQAMNRILRSHEEEPDSRPLVVSRYIHAMAMKCGNCQRKSMMKSIHASKLNLPEAAAIRSVAACPGKAPTSVHRVFFF